MDDYIADLDADNIAHLVTDEKSLVDAANEYYGALQKEGSGYSTKKFVENNTYEAVEKTVMEKLKIEDVNGDGREDRKDLLEDEDYLNTYLDTYKFLSRLEESGKGQRKDW